MIDTITFACDDAIEVRLVEAVLLALRGSDRRSQRAGYWPWH